MPHTDQIQALSEFLLEYATTLMGAGVHTNRAVRNISRIAAAYGYAADMTIFQRNITMSLISTDDENLRRTSVRKLKPLAFNLNLIQQLSELSWLPVDNNVSIEEMERAFRSIAATKRFSPWTDLLLVSVGNAAFCRLFNGDIWAMLTVFGATLLGFLAKQQFSRLNSIPWAWSSCPRSRPPWRRPAPSSSSSGRRPRSRWPPAFCSWFPACK